MLIDFLLKQDPGQRATASELAASEWIVRMSDKKATMRKHTSITNLPRFQVNAAESKKAAQQAAMVKKSISVTTLPRYAVNPTLAEPEFKSMRGRPKELDDEVLLFPVFVFFSSKSLQELRRMEEDSSSATDKPPPALGADVKKVNRRSLREPTGSSGSVSSSPGPGAGAGGGSGKGAKVCHKCEAKLGFIGGRVACDSCKHVFCKNCVSKKMMHPKFGKSCRFCIDCIGIVTKNE